MTDCGDVIPPPPGWGRGGRYPLTGVVIGPMWRWVWERLAGAEFVDGPALTQAAVDRFEVSPKTVDHVLRQAVAAGVLDSVLYRPAGSNRRSQRAYRVHPTWWAEHHPTTTRK